MMARAAALPPAGVRIGLFGTVLVHAVGIGMLYLSARSSAVRLPTTYAVELIAAPAPSAQRRAPPAAAGPPPEAEAPKAPAKARPTPVAPPRTPRTTTRQEPAARTSTPAVPLPGETPGTGSDIANVKVQGKEFPYPEYLRNIVTQIFRRWNRPAGSALTAEVGFVILRDGTVQEIRVVASSRSYSFDLEARAAVEAAGSSRAFGPLPPGYDADYLQVSFQFRPRER
ncbi:MAG TPA: TonB C-terminal domain-containing protein [Gemmatimonadales bacterium]|nr:TonB C-terminal domain-containing protein [Gemmatimonadales bacterium]